ncbi:MULTISPECIES: nucleobase:cation symporter-2 family protein [Dysgonomonas]|uniref:nucleobase:cation symporter-2 family protein n=1 Tax=Dysgonomonas TaxID=156973 RepID=UPI000927F08E|nr:MULTISPECIES: nucleobase:cation symporter-2 family protein [Dysgonomonas]MBN9300925.1 purine permease [Dysgonomonas mossii]OJX58065.1 MAG: xanthine permease XanP [Dysgonomonas sp. 37-18]
MEMTENEVDKFIQPIRKTDLIYQIEDNPPFKEAVFAGLQHLLAIFIAIITPPLIISQALNFTVETTGFLVSMALLASGISTFIQCRKFGPVGCGLLCIQGTSFSFIGALTASFAAKGDMGEAAILAAIFGVCIAASPVEMIVSRLLKYTKKIITPLVSGIVVTMIGLSLIKVAIISCGGGFNAMSVEGARSFGSMQNLGLAALVLVSILVLNSIRNKYIRMSSIIIGIIIGYVTAYFMGWIDFSKMGAIGVITIPQPFKYGLGFDLSAFIAVALIYFITSIEAYGDITANSMIGGEPIEGPKFMKRVQGGVLADGINSALAGVLNSFPNSIFAQNNGLIQLTGVASRRVGYYIAAFLVILSAFPFVGGIFSIMPEPVLGGATLLMFGTVAASGVRIIASQDIDRKAILVLAVSFACGLGVELVPNILSQMPATISGIFSSGITTGGVVAIIANVVIRIKE